MRRRTQKLTARVLGALLGVAALGVTPPATAQGPSGSVDALIAYQAKKLQFEAAAARGDHASTRAMRPELMAMVERAWGPTVKAASVLNQLGLMCQERGDLESATALLERAASLAERAQGPTGGDYGIVLSNLGMAWLARGDLTRARSICERSLQIQERAFGPDSEDVAHALNKLAEVHKAAGDLGAAEPLYERALTIRRRTKGEASEDVAVVLKNLADVRAFRGDFTRAREGYEQALAIFEKVQGPEGRLVGVACGDLAQALMLAVRSVPPSATRAEWATRSGELMDRAVAIAEKIFGAAHPELAKMVMQQGVVLLGLGDLDRAEPVLERAVTLGTSALGPDHFATAAVVNNLAILHVRKGNLPRGEALFRQALAAHERREGPRSNLAGTVLFNLSLVQVEQGKVDEAVQLRARAERILDATFRSTLAVGSERDKLVFFTSGMGGGYDATVALHLQHAPSSAPAARLAMEVVLARKGRVADALGAGMARARERLGSEGTQRLTRLSELRATIAQRSAQGRSAQELEQEEDRLQAELLASSSDYRLLASSPTVDDVARALPRGTALVEYVRFYKTDDKSEIGFELEHPRYAAYVLDGAGTLRWVDLGEAGPIDSLARAFRRNVGERSPTLPIVATELGARAWAPVAKLLAPGQPVLVAPDGALAEVPLQALLEGDRFVAETRAVSYLTSGRDVLRLRPESRTTSAPLLFADPDFGTKTHVAAGASPLSRAVFERLPGTRQEAEAVARLLPGVRLATGEQATEDAIKRAVSPRVLHVATHGYFLEQGGATRGTRGLVLERRPPSAFADNPMLLSGLAFAGANAHGSGALPGSGGDGLLSALEASSLDLRGTKLVVLSACETGLGELTSGEGVRGLRRAFAIAGAESLVSSLWKVDDEATRDLMVAFYEELAKGTSRSDALARAQRRTMSSPGRRHPYFWGAFVLYGAVDPIASGLGVQGAPTGPSGGGGFSRMVGLSLIVLGGASALAGGVAGALAWSKERDLAGACPDKACPAERMGDVTDARNLASWSTIGLIAGGSGIALGTVVLLLSGGPAGAPSSDAPRPPQKERIEPFVHVSGLGLRGTF